MYKLILNPKKISLKKKQKYFFLGKWFLKFIDKKKLKKINYKYNQDKYSGLNYNKEIKNEKKNRVIYNIILRELYPILNKTHSINWNLKTWNFFIGTWLHIYIFIINQRLELIKNLNLSKLNIEDQLNIGKNAWLINYNLRDFTHDAGLIKWNEKLMSRIIYLLITKNFSNEETIKQAVKFLPTKKEKLISTILYNLKNFFLNQLQKIFCKYNNIIFYNSYFKNKFKLIKLLIKLKNFPFIYSYKFFDDYVVKSGVNKDIRKKIMLNLKIKNLNLKIIKFLLPEIIPTIFLEGFYNQLVLAKNSYLPKKISKVFISSSYPINSFKFWLAEQLNNGTKLFHGQHGAGYNIFKHWFGDKYESGLSEKFFTWGKRKKFKNNISVGNFLLDNYKNKINYNKNLLLILPSTDIYRRVPSDLRYLNYFDEQVSQVQSIIDHLNYNKIKQFSIRPHPQDNRRELKYEKLLKFYQKFTLTDPKFNFQEIARKKSILIFTYLSTEFFSQIAANKPCFILFDKHYYHKNLTPHAKKDFKKLLKIGILHLNGKELAEKINNTINNFETWWCSKKVKATRINFCKNYTNPIFNEKKLIKALLKN